MQLNIENETNQRMQRKMTATMKIQKRPYAL